MNAITFQGVVNNAIPGIVRDYVLFTNLRSAGVGLSSIEYIRLSLIFSLILDLFGKKYMTVLERLDQKIGNDSWLKIGIKNVVPVATIGLSTICLNKAFSLTSRPCVQFFIYQLHERFVYRAVNKIAENLKLIKKSGVAQVQLQQEAQNKGGGFSNQVDLFFASHVKEAQLDAKKFNGLYVFCAGCLLISHFVFGRVFTNIFVMQTLRTSTASLATDLFAKMLVKVYKK